MKMIMILVIAIVVMIASPASAQEGWSGETEIGTDFNDGEFVSQYVFYDWIGEEFDGVEWKKKGDGVNLFMRYFWVNNTLNRFEIAFGPRFTVGKTLLKIQGIGFAAGSRNEFDFVAGLTLQSKIFQHDVLYIFDYKLDVGGDDGDETTFATLANPHPHTIYQKLFVGVTRSGRWQLRAEHLRVNGGTGFVRLGLEHQYPIKKTGHIFVAPFYDPTIDKPGVQFGFRFF